MLSVLIRSLNRIFDFFFPPVCFVCGRRERRYICGRCLKEIRERNIEDYGNLLRLKKNHPEIRNIIFLGDYKGNLRKNILSIKINKDRRKMKNAVSALVEAFDIKADHILTVPSFKEKPYHTYNVVKYLSFICNINFPETALQKIIKTKKQKKLKKDERIKNLDGVFSKNMFGIFKKNSKIVIFDDIITTGNTVEKILDTLNTGEVYIISLAVAVKRTKD